MSQLPEWIYVIKRADTYGIGRSVRPPDRFRSDLSKSKIKGVELLLSARVKDGEGTEALLHQFFKKKRFRGKWFKLSTGDVDKLRSFLRGKSEFSTTPTHSTTSTDLKGASNVG